MFPSSHVEDRLTDDQTNIRENSCHMCRTNHCTGERRTQTVLKATGECNQISRDIQRHANAIDRPRGFLKNRSSCSSSVEISLTYCNEISRGQSDTFEKQCQSVRSLHSKGRSADQRPRDETSRDERDDREEKMQGSAQTSIGKGIDHSRRSAGRCRDRTFEEANHTNRIDKAGDERQNTAGENQAEKRANSIQANVSSRRDDRRSTFSSHHVRRFLQEYNSQLNQSSRTFGCAVFLFQFVFVDDPALLTRCVLFVFFLVASESMCNEKGKWLLSALNRRKRNRTEHALSSEREAIAMETWTCVWLAVQIDITDEGCLSNLGIYWLARSDLSREEGKRWTTLLNVSTNFKVRLQKTMKSNALVHLHLLWSFLAMYWIRSMTRFE